MTYIINSITATKDPKMLLLNVTGDIGEGEEEFQYGLQDDDNHGIAPQLRQIIEDAHLAGTPYTVIPYSPPSVAELKALYEQKVQAHVDSKARELGYDNINTIAKYLVPGNEFYDECVSLSLWCGMVWKAAFAMFQQVADGEITIPTEQQALASLPTYPLGE